MNDNRFNLASRLIHWAIVFTVVFLIVTVLLRMGWMNKDHFGIIIQNDLTKLGKHISKDEAASIGKNLRRPMWNNHILAGYLLIGLYIIRMLITLKQGLAFPSPFSKDASVKSKLKSWLYIIFYILMLISLFTGFMIVNGPKSWKEPLEFVHIKSLYYVVSFIILHIGGVLIADATNERGIVSKMISGEESNN